MLRFKFNELYDFNKLTQQWFKNETVNQFYKTIRQHRVNVKQTHTTNII